MLIHFCVRKKEKLTLKSLISLVELLEKTRFFTHYSTYLNFNATKILVTNIDPIVEWSKIQTINH